MALKGAGRALEEAERVSKETKRASEAHERASEAAGGHSRGQRRKLASGLNRQIQDSDGLI